MGAMDQAMSVEDFEVLANRNLRGFELRGEVGDQHTSVMVQEVDDGATAFFVEQGSCWAPD